MSFHLFDVTKELSGSDVYDSRGNALSQPFLGHFMHRNLDISYAVGSVSEVKK